MDQNGIGQVVNQFTRKKELFYTSYSLNSYFTISDLYRLLILIDKHYDYLLKDRFDVISDWHNIEHFGFNDKKDYELLICPSLFYQESIDVKKGFISDAFSISIIPNNNYLIFNLYADLYTNIRYGLDEKNQYYKIVQSQAAELNREKLTNFLKELEVVLDGKISEYNTDNHLTKESIFKYGFRDSAALIEDDYNDEL